jgi:hypothetical protein
MFNLQARYPEYKKKFYDICTDEYTEEFNDNPFAEEILKTGIEIYAA